MRKLKFSVACQADTAIVETDIYYACLWFVDLSTLSYAANFGRGLVVPYGYMRGYSWLATPNNIESFMEYARFVMEDMFPGFDDGLYMEQGYSIRIFETHDFIKIMNLGISMAAIFIYSFTALLTLIGLTSVISTISTNIRMRSREFAILQSVGMTYSGLKHMLNLESIMCSAKSIFFGLPIAIVLTYLIHVPIRSIFPVTYQLPWIAIILCIFGIFAITGLTMRFSVSRLRNENIIESIR